MEGVTIYIANGGFTWEEFSVHHLYYQDILDLLFFDTNR